MESIKKIVPSSRDGEFVITFEGAGAKEAQLICQSLDRDRDMWVHGLSLFKKEHTKFKQHLCMLKKTDRRFVKELKRNAGEKRSENGSPSLSRRSSSVSGISGRPSGRL